MGYRCGLCREEIEREEQWRDAHGDLIKWGDGRIKDGPAPYHPDCGIAFAEGKTTSIDEMIAILPAPRLPKKGQMSLF